MKSVKNILVLILVLFSFIEGRAQDATDRIWSEIDSISMNRALPGEDASISRLSFNTTLGTSFTYAPHYGSAMNMYVAPHASFSASKRLTFHGGLLASHTSLLPYKMNSEFPVSQGLNTMSVFVAASYHLSENLIIHGAGMKSLMPYPGSSDNPMLNFQDLSVGATFHFGHFSIGASIHSVQNLYLGSPLGFGNSMYTSPLYW